MVIGEGKEREIFLLGAQRVQWALRGSCAARIPPSDDDDDVDDDYVV